jgi:hypothetical protein
VAAQAGFVARISRTAAIQNEFGFLSADMLSA